MIMDATCARSNIRYPQDASLLNEARENTEKLLDELHDLARNLAAIDEKLALDRTLSERSPKQDAGFPG